jgi:hypothetical protein
MELENIILSGVSQAQKVKATCFLSCVEYRPNPNTSNIMKNRSGKVTNGRRTAKEGS